MRILKLHNLHRSRGGENESYESENRLLEQHGHTVKTLEFDNRSIPDNPSAGQAISLAVDTVWSAMSKSLVEDTIRLFRPNLVHVENTYPLISPSAYAATKNLRTPVVHSVRNYRLVCPSATLFRDGHYCEDCVGKIIPFPGVMHGCYQESRSKTAVTAAMLTVHRIRRTWTRDVDRYIATSSYVRDRLVDGGVPARLISIKPNFVHPDPLTSVTSGSGALFVGRLSREKGFTTLLDAWSRCAGCNLSIVGDGPLRDLAISAANESAQVTFLGQQSAADVYDTMGSSAVIVVPSEWPEPFGRVIIESYAKGKAVIASRVGGIPEIVVNGQTGLLFEPGDSNDLAAKVRWAVEHPEEMRRMGENARREYEAKYTPERNYEMLMDIYEQAIAHARQRRA